MCTNGTRATIIANQANLPPSAEQKVTFALFDVRPCARPLPRTTASDLFEKLLLSPVEACSVGDETPVKSAGFHGLIETAHTAFGLHYGLDLSPDDIWITIAQGLARLVNNDPSAFRNSFDRHTGRKTIQIRRNDFRLGSPNNDWPSCFGDFSSALREGIGEEKHQLLVSDFTTTGPIQRATSEVVLMDTVQSYFKFRLRTMCGIPFVTLRGTEGDWSKLAQKVRRLAQLGGLDWWLNDVSAIADQLVATAQGKINLDFWNSAYKSQSTSGGFKMTGWLLKLLPLVESRKGGITRNPLLGQPNTEPHRLEEKGFLDDPEIDHNEPHVTSSQLPASLSTVPFEWEYLGNLLNYQLAAGIVGLAQSASDLSLRPQMGWAIRPIPQA
jgi:hypothetical protein